MGELNHSCLQIESDISDCDCACISVHNPVFEASSQCWAAMVWKHEAVWQSVYSRPRYYTADMLHLKFPFPTAANGDQVPCVFARTGSGSTFLSGQHPRRGAFSVHQSVLCSPCPLPKYWAYITVARSC